MALVDSAQLLEDEAMVGTEMLPRQQLKQRWRMQMSLTVESTQATESMGARQIVASLEGVSKNYGLVQALRAVDFQVRAGELVALLGPNGAGKTTVVKLLLGLMPPHLGRVRVFGGDPTNPETAAGLEKLGDHKFGDLSGGQRQRVLFGLAICGDPDVLFLDEPTVGLDVEARRMLWDEIRRLVERGKTVLLTTHYLQEADSLADRIAVINQGAIIAQGTPAEIKAQTSGKRIRCITGLNINSVRQIPGVTEVREDREALEIHAREAEPVVRELLARDPKLGGLEISSAGLEEAFLALTKDNGQNGNRQN